jgi:hypothetical protein
MIRAARLSAPRIATAVRQGVQERRFIRTCSYKLVTALPRTLAPVYTPARTFWNSAKNTTAMASATSFFDFKPKDSTSPSSTHSACAQHLSTAPRTAAVPQTSLPSHCTQLTPHRARRRIPSLQAQRQSRPRRQHRVQVRFHPAICRPGEALQRPKIPIRRLLRDPRLPLQPVRWPGPRV